MNRSRREQTATPGEPSGTTCLCNVLRRASCTVSRLYDGVRDIGLRTTQYSLLLLASPVRRNPAADLAELTPHEETTLTRNLRPLVDARWVAVRTGKDRREKWLIITADGAAKLEEAQPRRGSGHRRGSKGAVAGADVAEAPVLAFLRSRGSRTGLDFFRPNRCIYRCRPRLKLSHAFRTPFARMACGLVPYGVVMVAVRPRRTLAPRGREVNNADFALARLLSRPCGVRPGHRGRQRLHRSGHGKSPGRRDATDYADFTAGRRRWIRSNYGPASRATSTR